MEHRLRKSRLEKEQVLRLVEADAVREERLENMARKENGDKSLLRRRQRDCHRRWIYY